MVPELSDNHIRIQEMTDRIFTPKEDPRKNAEVPEAVVKTHKEKMGRLKPLRINARTVIYVTENKCNEAYRQEYLKRMGEVKDESDKHPCFSPHAKRFSREDVADKIVELYRQGMAIKEIVATLHVSNSTCCKYINKYKRCL